MKREYIIPSIIVVTVDTSAILQNSNEKTFSLNGGTDKGWADARESFGFEEISEEE